MASITVSVTDIIPANHEVIYTVIADYHTGHQAILPRPAFKEMKVLEGGFGAGTRTHIHVRIFGQSYYYEQIIEEPEVGRILVERDIHTGQTSTFTLDPLSENETWVTITAIQPLSAGFKGLLERISQPTIMRNLFKTELQQLADYVTRTDVAMQSV